MLYLKTYLMGILRMKHKSVLLKESIDNLNIKVDGVYVDATLGFGGHSLEILKRINKGFLFAFDQDNEAIQYSKERLKDYNNFKINLNYNSINKSFESMPSLEARILSWVFDSSPDTYKTFPNSHIFLHA